MFFIKVLVLDEYSIRYISTGTLKVVIMTRKHYVNLSIPETLMEEVDKVIIKKVKGYTSRAEFVKDAIRDKLKETTR